MSVSWPGVLTVFFDTFRLLLLGCLRGEGGRCFPWTALSSWPMFQLPGSPSSAQLLSSAVTDLLEIVDLLWNKKNNKIL